MGFVWEREGVEWLNKEGVIRMRKLVWVDMVCPVAVWRGKGEWGKEAALKQL